MFTFQNKVPDYYMKESRDFQLFPRLDDVVFMGIHQDIDTITELNNPKKCKNSYLNYLAEKVGFYTDEYIPDVVLTNIISAFKTAVKNKGTLLGIQQAVIAILKAENSIEPPKIIYVKGSDQNSDYWEQYTINIYTPIKIINQVALKEFLKYIIPAGHNFNIYVYEDAGIDSGVTKINNYDAVNLVKASNADIGVVRADIEYTDSEILEREDITSTDSKILSRLLGTADMGMVVSGEDIFDKEGNLKNLNLPQVKTAQTYKEKGQS